MGIGVGLEVGNILYRLIRRKFINNKFFGFFNLLSDR